MRARGELQHPNHLLHYWIVAAGQLLLSPLGLPLFDELGLVNAGLVALGTGVAHAAGSRFGLARGPCFAFALLQGLAPVTIFYATVYELPGAFFPFVAGAELALAHAVAAPGWARGAVLGLVTGLATGAHATGHLVLAIVLPWLVLAAERGGTSRAQQLRAAGAALACHALTVACLGWLLRARRSEGPVATQFELLANYFSVRLDLLPASIWHEWLVAFGLLAWVWLLAFQRAETRWLGWLVLLPFVPYQALSFFLVAYRDEHGTYMLPLVAPAAYAAVRLLSLRGLALVLVAGLGLGAVTTWQLAAAAGPQPGQAQVAALTADGRAIVLFVDPASLQPLVRHQPGLTCVALHDVRAPDRPYAEVCSVFDVAFTRFRADGRPIVIAEACLDWLRHQPLPPQRHRFVHEHLLRRYAFTPQQAASFRYLVVTPKD